MAIPARCSRGRGTAAGAGPGRTGRGAPARPAGRPPRTPDAGRGGTGPARAGTRRRTKAAARGGRCRRCRDAGRGRIPTRSADVRGRPVRPSIPEARERPPAGPAPRPRRARSIRPRVSVRVEGRPRHTLILCRRALGRDGSLILPFRQIHDQGSVAPHSRGTPRRWAPSDRPRVCGPTLLAPLMVGRPANAAGGRLRGRAPRHWPIRTRAPKLLYSIIAVTARGGTVIPPRADGEADRPRPGRQAGEGAIRWRTTGPESPGDAAAP